MPVSPNDKPLPSLSYLKDGIRQQLDIDNESVFPSHELREPLISAMMALGYYNTNSISSLLHRFYAKYVGDSISTAGTVTILAHKK